MHSKRYGQRRRRSHFRRRVLNLESLEPRTLLTAAFAAGAPGSADFSEAAYQLLHQRVRYHTDHFYVYRDADSGFNRATPSGFFAGDQWGQRPDLRDQIRIDAACVFDASQPAGCSVDPNALDRERGTVMQMTSPPFQGSTEFAGLYFEEPEGFSAAPRGRGYDLRDTTHVILEAYSPTPGGVRVQFAVAGRNTDRNNPIEIGDDWQTISVPLASLRHPDTNFISPPVLSNVQLLFGIVFSSPIAPAGGTVLLNDVRFVRLEGHNELPPANPTGAPQLALPAGTESFGVVPAKLWVADDGCSAFQTDAGTWTVQSVADAYGGEYHKSAGTAGAQASWTFSALEPRHYVVQATWPPAADQATVVRFELYDNDALRAVAEVDQTRAPAEAHFDGQDWDTLGTAAVESGVLHVIVSATHQALAADAVRIVPTIPPDQAFPNLAPTYEAAMTIMALLERQRPEDLEAARLIADTLVYALQHDNQGGGAQLPTAEDGARGLRDAYSSGVIGWFNDQSTDPDAARAGQAKLAGFSSDPRLCGPSGYCLVLDGAFGGNNAFSIMALMRTYFALGDPVYLDAAQEIGRWIVGNLTDRDGPAFNPDPATQSFGGYFLGYPDQGVPKDRTDDLMRGKSIENNADIFAAFVMIATAERAVGNAAEAAMWTEWANVAGDFVMTLYEPGDPADPRDGHFHAGTLPIGPYGPPRGPGLEPDGELRGDEVINVAAVLDSATFSLLALAASPRYHAWPDRHGNPIDWREPLRYTLDTFAQQITVTSSGTAHMLEGFNIVAHPTASQFRPGGPLGGLPTGIAWEFTAQTVVAMDYLDDLYRTAEFAEDTAKYLGQLKLAQIVAPFTDGKGLVASTLDQEDDRTGYGYPPLDQCLGTPFQCIPERVGLAATTWGIFADRSNRSSPFVLQPWQNPVNPWDVTGNGHVEPLDALTVINRLNLTGAGRLPVPPLPTGPPPYYDVNGDGIVAPLDVLIVINYLNRQAADGQESAEAEGFDPSLGIGVAAIFMADSPAGHTAAPVPQPQEWSRSALAEFDRLPTARDRSESQPAITEPRPMRPHLPARATHYGQPSGSAEHPDWFDLESVLDVIVGEPLAGA